MTFLIHLCLEVKLNEEETTCPRKIPDRAKDEVDCQKKRELGKFQTIYRNPLLIPTDPAETPNSEIESRPRLRCDLREFYEEWYRLDSEKRKHFDIAN